MLSIKYLDNLGDIKGAIYDFEKANDVLAKHNHTKDDVHITIVARGKIKAYSHDWETEADAGQIIDFKPNEPHEIMALEDNTRIINIIKKYNGVVNDGQKAPLPKVATSKAEPEIKIMAVSNVFTRLMTFKNAGDIEKGHQHTYDHGTLVSSGSVLVDVYDDFANPPIASKVFTAPSMVYIPKDKFHKLTALTDNTVCACIHALRTVDSDLLDPSFFVTQINGGNNEIFDTAQAKYGLELQAFTGG
jgi:quercetin dioxygenase-like cupin family protein